MRLNFFYNSGDFTKAQLISEQKIARAATGAVNEAAELGKKAARASIAFWRPSRSARRGMSLAWT